MNIVPVVAVLLSVSAAAHKGHDHAAEAKAGEKVTLSGEVIDLSCWLDHKGKGKEHAKCAKACLLEKKVPAGLLTPEGKVYLLVPDHRYEEAFKPVPEMAAMNVKITGRMVLSGGLPGILVEKAEK